jgi:hypothetical protein
MVARARGGDERSTIVGPAGQDVGMASTIPGPVRDFVRTVTQADHTATSGDDAAT